MLSLMLSITEILFNENDPLIWISNSRWLNRCFEDKFRLYESLFHKKKDSHKERASSMPARQIDAISNAELVVWN